MNELPKAAGGETVFYDGGMIVKPSHSGKQPTNTAASITPSSGRAIVFNHDVIHQGTQLPPSVYCIVIRPDIKGEEEEEGEYNNENND